MAKITSPFQFLQTVRDTDAANMEPDTSAFRIGNITTYTMGNTTADVRLDGEDVDGIVPCTFVGSYTPWVGDRVLLARMGTTLSKTKHVIVGRINASPDYMWKQKDLDQSNATTTLVDDNDLSVLLEANAFYRIILNLFCFGVDAADLKVALGVQSAWITDLGFNAPSGLIAPSSVGQTDWLMNVRGQTGVTTTNTHAFSTVTNIPTLTIGHGFIQTGASSGFVVVRFAQNTANASASWLLARSGLEVRRVG